MSYPYTSKHDVTASLPTLEEDATRVARQRLRSAWSDALDVREQFDIGEDELPLSQAVRMCVEAATADFAAMALLVSHQRLSYAIDNLADAIRETNKQGE
jgi:hypothetical protein